MKHRVLLVDDDAAIRDTFAHHLGRADFSIATADSAESALTMIADVDPDVVVTDVRMPGMNGLELVRLLRERIPGLNVVVITAYEDKETAVGAMRAGAFDYLVKPLDLDQIELVLERASRDRRLRQRIDRTTEDEGRRSSLDRLAGRDPGMIEIFKRIGALSTNRTPVLIRGETGTGKELIARAIHFNSAWAGEPFVAVNCTAVPESLLESELFGHLRGSFTGAVANRRGRFELAGRGTIFLDEIGDIGPPFQAKLLRVLQEGEFHPVGSERPRQSEARVIAATHVALEERVRAGTFREDLYFRLRVVELVVPPLRERREDLPILVEFLLSRIRQKLHRPALSVSAAAMNRLVMYEWPGNVRELENALLRGAVLSPSGVLEPGDFALDARARVVADDGGDTLDDAERRHVLEILRRTGGNKRAACRILDISRPRLDRIVARHGIVSSSRDHGGNDA
jgi:two-component system response regulator AtoC